MIKELFHWTIQLIFGLFTFKPSRIKYDFANLYWYLRYGFTYWDIQDLDQYLTIKISKMLPFHRAFSNQEWDSKKHIELCELQALSERIFTYEFEMLNPFEQIKLKNRFLNLLHKYYFSFWF